MLFYTSTTYPGQGTAQEGRPGLGGALTYAHVRSLASGHVPCPVEVDAVGCTAAALAAKPER